MKKIAVYTWCYDIGKTNYGQTLQCYATQEILKKLGYFPIVLRYREPMPGEHVPEFNNSEHRLRYEREYRIKYIEGYEDERINAFFDFINENIVDSIPCYTEDELKIISMDVDTFICGGDQLWSPELFDPVTLFRFARNNQRKISYATSGMSNSGKKAWLVYKKICDELKNFDAVSVRENSGKAIIEGLIDKKVEVVLDPTLLLPESDWEKLCTSRVADEEYIFAFFLGPFTYNKIVLKALMKKYGVKKIIYVKSSYFKNEGIVSEGKFIEAEGVGPKEFLSLVRNATAVYTDSYHGSVFSIIFRKQFYVVRHRDPYRIVELCEKLKIGKRIAESIVQMEKLADIDYSCVEKELNNLRDQSICFLSENIGI